MSIDCQPPNHLDSPDAELGPQLRATLRCALISPPPAAAAVDALWHVVEARMATKVADPVPTPPQHSHARGAVRRRGLRSVLAGSVAAKILVGATFAAAATGGLGAAGALPDAVQREMASILGLDGGSPDDGARTAAGDPKRDAFNSGASGGQAVAQEGDAGSSDDFDGQLDATASAGDDDSDSALAALDEEGVEVEQDVDGDDGAGSAAPDNDDDTRNGGSSGSDDASGEDDRSSARGGEVSEDSGSAGSSSPADGGATDVEVDDAADAVAEAPDVDTAAGSADEDDS